MLMFTLVISCLTTSNLPWFMDLTFQVPMQYCPLQHWTLLLSPVPSTTCCCFHKFHKYSVLIELPQFSPNNESLKNFLKNVFSSEIESFLLDLFFRRFLVSSDRNPDLNNNRNVFHHTAEKPSANLVLGMCVSKVQTIMSWFISLHFLNRLLPCGEK